ncbi:MAG: gliding motility-associated C-terminal domain-containing protein [Bacteroidales bacterium]|nr:gliding motility-associated C-terminal domain-containing protein [Bacteroidales bacterium]
MKLYFSFITFLIYSLVYSQIQEIKPITCPGGSDGALMVIPESNQSPYTYLWSNGQTTQAIWNLPTGTYSVTVTDNGGNQYVYSHQLNEPPAFIAVVLELFPNSCIGHYDGGIICMVGGGTPGYNYIWRNLEFDSLYYNTSFIVGVIGGHYELTVIDTLGCVFKDTFLIPILDTVQVDVQMRGYVCNGAMDLVSLTATEATVGHYFTFEWNTVHSGYRTFTTNDSVFGVSIPLLAGNYTITVTDDQTGCKAYVPIQVKETQSPLTIQYTKVDNECFELASGRITLFIHGGDPAPEYVVNWVGPNGFTATGTSISNLSAGAYQYQVRDSIACTVQGTITIFPSPPFCIPDVVTPNNDGFNDVFEIIDLCNVTNIQLYIYDMYGKLVYSTTDCAFQWNPLDHEVINHTVYYYHLIYTYQQQQFEKKGSIDVKF